MPGSSGVTVFFNGKKLQRCVEADDVEGRVLCGIGDGLMGELAYARLVDAQDDDGMAVWNHYGNVSIEFDTDENRRKAEDAQCLAS